MTSTWKLPTLICLALLFSTLPSASQEDGPPRYPSRRGFEPIPITDQDYGYYPWAKDALQIGDKLPHFRVPKGDGSDFDSYDKREADLLIVFYRGFW